MNVDPDLAKSAASIRNAKRRLPIGARVRMSPGAVKMFPRYDGVLGTVVALIEHGTGASPKVLWDGRKTADGYAPWLILRVREEPNNGR